MFTAKNDFETGVFDTDRTWLHKSHLFNYLGVRSISGDEFLVIAYSARERGADLREQEVTDVEFSGDGLSSSPTSS